MAVFKLDHENQFIRTQQGSSNLHVYVYTGDLNAFDLIHVAWRPSIEVGPSPGAFSKKLEVHGVTIESHQLEQLIKDLTWVDPYGRRFFPMVNRQGRCLMYLGCEPLKQVRLNDQFGWSKYGVELKPPQIGTWSSWDMKKGTVLVTAPASCGNGDGGIKDSGAAEIMWKKVVEEKDRIIEEKDKLMEKSELMLRKSLEEKEKENVSLKAALKALISN